MSALAQALLAEGRAVSGADRLVSTGGTSAALERLAAAGVKVYPDDGSGVTDEVTRAVISTAIEETNPGLAAARARGIPVVHRAAALAELLSSRKLVAVAGTCGKSTVTAILGHLLAYCGYDPLVVNGAAVVGWNGSTRPGKGAFAVAEVDESDKSLTAFHPYAAIVTNASADHYSKEEMDEVFDAFVCDVPGPVIDGRREAVVPSGLARRIALPGEHNAVNAECAIRMARALGADEAKFAEALASFPGVERRLERIGMCADAVVYDDYAHNPEKLHAMLVTLQQAFPRGVAVLWRPHGYAPLCKMLDALAAMFRETLRPADALYLLPVYDAGGTTDRSVNSDALLARLGGVRAVGVKDLAEAETVLRREASAFGALVTCGARDPGLPALARRLTGKE